MRDEFTTRAAIAARPHLKTIQAGDWLYVWDGVAEREVWCQVDDAVEVDGGMRFRAIGCNFYFDESLVISFARDTERRAEVA